MHKKTNPKLTESKHQGEAELNQGWTTARRTQSCYVCAGLSAAISDEACKVLDLWGGLKVTRVFNNTSTYLQILSPTPATVEPREAEAAASTLN